MEVVQFLVAVVNSNGVRNGRSDGNVEVLQENGFLVTNRVKLPITTEQASALTSNVDVKHDFMSGPVEAVLLKRVNAYKVFAQIRDDLDDMYGSCDEWSTLRDRAIFFPSAQRLERTLVISLPGASESGLATILDTVEKNGFVVIDKTAQTLSLDVAKKVVGEAQAELVASGECTTIVVEKIGAVDEWKLLMGPANPELAKQIAPRSLHAVLGTDAVQNGVFGSSTSDKAGEDIDMCFPGPFPLERTLAIVKADVIQNGFLNDILSIISSNNFTVQISETLHISPERAEQLVAVHGVKGEGPEFTAQVSYLSSGPCVAMVLTKPGAISAWKKLCGPADPEVAVQINPSSLRARFGTDAVYDGVHCSVSAEAAKAEIDAYFPQLAVEQVPGLEEVEEIMNEKPAPRPYVSNTKSLNEVLVDGLTELCRVKPVGMDAVTWLGEWLLRNNPNKPVIDEPVEVAEELSVSAAVAAAASVEQASIVWAVGGPGSGRDEQCADLAKTQGYDLVDVAALYAAAVESGSEYGELIQKVKELGKSVPTHVTTALIKEAMLRSKGSSKFVVNGFPGSLDDAFGFEETIGVPEKCLYFECSEGTRNKRLGGDMTSEQEQMWTSFQDDVLPVVDHYATFKKLAKVSTDGGDSIIKNRVAQALR